MKKLKIGLVGLPNVGKSSFFEMISKKQVLIANYPFSTINPNISNVNFYDKRVLQLGNFFKSKKLTFDAFELIDIAGIIRGASQKVGLGGEFLSNIRSVDLICHVVRCFGNDNVIHVEENVSSVRDIDIIKLEFVNADMQQIEKRLEKIEKNLKKENSKQLLEEKDLLQKINVQLAKEIPVSKMNLKEEEKIIIKNYNLLTSKPSIIIANYNFDNLEELKKLQDNQDQERIIPIDIGLESDYKSFTNEEKAQFGYSQFDLDDFSKAIINSLELKSFFTAGESESRNWICDSNASAVECAGLIHSDIKNRFVRVEIYHIKELGNEINYRREPASYLIVDGEVCNFLFS